MTDILDQKTAENPDEIKALAETLRSGSPRERDEALAKLFDFRRALNSSVEVTNLDTGNHLLGVMIDWNGHQKELRIPPNGGKQRIDNFAYLLIRFIRLHVDPPVRLTNRANYSCFYEVNKLLGNGQSQQQQFLNPQPGATEVYDLWPGQRLIVVPVGMGRFMLQNNLDPACLLPEVRQDSALEEGDENEE